jgi:shikimate kinase
VKHPVVLVGMPATGKTTAGQWIANWAVGFQGNFIDTDRVIENRLGESISGIITHRGEPWFRYQETMAFHAVIQAAVVEERQVIIATGAGLVEDPLNRILLKLTTTICLFAPLPVLLARMQGDTTRPLWNGPRGEEALRERWARRAPLYQEVASGIVDSGGNDPMVVVRRILNLIGSLP